jgi:muramoyltetrapeptide carboxypeptidase LdcA involved in peptidoglycan recycling
VIRRNPKVFLGYSDTTVTHFMCMKAGLSSMYGPSILAEFAENGEIFDYTVKNLEKALFGNGEIGRVEPSEYWTGELIEWTIENKDKRKKLEKHTGYEALQGSKPARGRLIGGCVEVIEMLKGTSIWDASDFDGTIVFFDTSEDTITPRELKYMLRNYGAQGILGRISGMIWSKPYANKYYGEYKEVIRETLAEFGADNLPVLCNANFGHTEPMFVLPYGAEAEIDPVKQTFTILEQAVL